MTRIAYRVSEVAEALSVSERLVWRMIESGEIRSFKAGRCRRIPLSEVRRLTGEDAQQPGRQRVPISRETRRLLQQL